MASITIQQEMQEYLAELNEEEQILALQLVKSLFATHQGQSERTSIEDYNKEIDEALEEVAQCNYITQHEMEKPSAQWHKR